MKIKILIIITLFAMSFCTGKKKSLNSNKEIIALHTDSLDNSFNSEFCQCVSAYIQDTKKSLRGAPVYYSVYFFSKDNIDYFTIWAEYVSYSGRTEYNNPMSNYIKINDIDVLVIGKEMELSQCCNFLTQEDNIYKRKEDIIYERFIYDGIHNEELLEVETCRYSIKNGKYVLEKLKFPIVDIFSDM